MGILAVGGFTLGTELGAAPALDAAPASDSDTDGDGLSDVLERVRWMSPFDADTDADGFSDLEEFARHSDPQDPLSLPRPTTAGTDIALGSYAIGERLHTVIAFYGEGTALYERDIHVGVGLLGQLFDLPPAAWLTDASVRAYAASKRNAQIVLVDSVAPVHLVHQFGQVSIFATLAFPGHTVDTADALNLFSSGGQVVLELVGPPSWMNDLGGEVMMAQKASPGAGPLQGPAPHGGTTTAGGGIYRPVSTGDVPVTWHSGELCVQSTVDVGGTGPMGRHLIQEASCEEADGYCSSTCVSLSGGFVDILDPISLIGG